MKQLIFIVPVLLALTSQLSTAATIFPCNTGNKQAWLNPSQQCNGFSMPEVNGSTLASELSTLYGGNWSHIAERTSTSDINSYLNVDLTSGSWGSSPVSGEWSIIDANFWSTYSHAVITMHVGNGGGDPDIFTWLLTDNSTSGTFSYYQGQQGLSNIKLWGSPGGVTVSEPTSLAILGLGLISLAFARRRAV